MSNNFYLNEPVFDSRDIKSVKESVKNGWVSTAGNQIKIFENKLSKYTNSKYVLACINGTSGLHISLKVLGVKDGDEVIVPTLTFVASVNSIIYNNAKPIFMDCDKFFNIDVEKTIKFLNNNTYLKNNYSYNKKTKKRISAIIVVHVWGNAVNLNKLIKKCKKLNIKILEDATESLGTFYKDGKHTGTLGDIGVISFNGNKIITTGGGGAILTKKIKYYKKIDYLINQAKDNSLYFVHNEVGYNYRMTNLNASLGNSQLIKINNILKKKILIRSWYIKYLDPKNSKIAEVPNYSDNNNWLILITFIKNINIKKIIKYLILKKIHVRPIWKLNHNQKMFKNFENFEINNANIIINKSLCLPSSIKLKERDVKLISFTINNFLK